MVLPSVTGLAKLTWHHRRYVEHLITRKLKFLSRYRWAEEHVDRDNKVPPPLVYKLVLTYKCNLRCTFCYEWGQEGWCLDEPSEEIKKELPWGVVEKIFVQAGHDRPSFILSGGEPLLYSRFPDLAKMLKQNKCVAITCTNGLLLHRFQDVSKDNPYLTYLISLDGLAPQNDRLRGKGVYDRVTANIKVLKSLKNPPYVGVQFTIRPENVVVMYDFCQEMVRLGVDWILLNLCWFVSKEQAKEYEDFMVEHFGKMPTSHLSYVLPYDLDKEEFVRQYGRIKSEAWPIQISCYLEKPEDIYTFVDKPQVPPRNTFCYKQWLRMDVTPDGTVAPCILYPDVLVGDLRQDDVLRVWNSPSAANFRELRRKEHLPVCSKCDVLYLYDAHRKVL